MKRILPIILIVWFSFAAFFSAAQPSLSAGYSYLLSPEWDKIFQTYNFSRPWQSEKLLPLQNIYSLRFAWNLPLYKARGIHIQPAIGYSRCMTSATNEGNLIRAGFQMPDVQMEFRISPRALIKGVYRSGVLGPRFFVTITPGFVSFIPSVVDNKKPFEISEDEVYRPVTFAFNSSFGVGYHAIHVGRVILTPKLSATLFPTAELEDFASAVIGTNLTQIKNEASNVWMFNASIQFTIPAKTNNWWDTPGGS
jgi:hypothetical protein